MFQFLFFIKGFDGRDGAKGDSGAPGLKVKFMYVCVCVCPGFIVLTTSTRYHK